MLPGNALDLARLQFAVTTATHFLFVLLTLGLVTHVAILQNPSATPFATRPSALRLRVNFLSDTAAFSKLGPDGERGLQGSPDRAPHRPRALHRAVHDSACLQLAR